MDGNEEGDGWGDIDPGDSVWEQEAASLSMFEPPPFTAGFCDIWEFRVGLGRRFSALAREQGGGGEGQGIRGQRGKRWGELCDIPVVTAWGGACAPWLPEGSQLLFGPSRRPRPQGRGHRGAHVWRSSTALGAAWLTCLAACGGSAQGGAAPRMLQPAKPAGADCSPKNALAVNAKGLPMHTSLTRPVHPPVAPVVGRSHNRQLFHHLNPHPPVVEQSHNRRRNTI